MQIRTNIHYHEASHVKSYLNVPNLSFVKYMILVLLLVTGYLKLVDKQKFRIISRTPLILSFTFVIFFIFQTTSTGETHYTTMTLQAMNESTDCVPLHNVLTVTLWVALGRIQSLFTIFNLSWVNCYYGDLSNDLLGFLFVFEECMLHRCLN